MSDDSNDIQPLLTFQERTGRTITRNDKPPTNGQSAVMHLLANGEKGTQELMDAAGYKDKRSFRLSVLNGLITNGLVAMPHP